MSRPSDMPTIEAFEHGTRAKYVCGCRCENCRTANRVYAHKRAKTKIFHGPNPLVPAETACLHLRRLSGKGVGRRAVERASGVPNSILLEIRMKRKTMIRRTTEDRILKVDLDARAGHALVPADKTWKMINELIEEGFTKAELARRLGYARPALQIRKDRITAETERKVLRFYDMIMAI